MAKPALGDYDMLSIRPAQNGGWIVSAHAPDSRIQGETLAAVSDDEGLLEWLAERFGLAAPELADAINGHPATAAPAIPQAVIDALQPFVEWVSVRRNESDRAIVAYEKKPESEEYLDIEFRHVRALIKAAGLFTDEMQAHPPNPGPDAKQPEDQRPPAAERVDEGVMHGGGQSFDADQDEHF